jgi:Ca2+-binding RTX toxin-like protein
MNAAIMHPDCFDAMSAGATAHPAIREYQMARIQGKTTADLLKGSNVGDEIFGNSGNDKLYGFGGNDDLEGGKGNDTLVGGAGNDELEGGSGKDLFVYGSGRDEIEDFNVRDDKVSLDTSLGISSFSELMTKAMVVDGGEDVLFTFGNGNTLLLEDVDINSLTAEHFSFNATENSATVPVIKGEKVVGTAGIDILKGGNSNDELYGQAGNDRLHGGAGHDDLKGGVGNDKLYGGSGNDELEGGAGKDRLDGGSGRNELEGGSGSDTFVFSTGITTIEDFRPGTDKMEISTKLGVSSFSELIGLAKVVDGGDDIRIDFGKAVLTFDDTSLSQLKPEDFLFV